MTEWGNGESRSQTSESREVIGRRGSVDTSAITTGRCSSQRKKRKVISEEGRSEQKLWRVGKGLLSSEGTLEKRAQSVWGKSLEGGAKCGGAVPRICARDET